jgi:hypothetical protein
MREKQHITSESITSEGERKDLSISTTHLRALCGHLGLHHSQFFSLFQIEDRFGV